MTAPQNPDDRVTVFAQTTFRHQRVNFGIKQDDRRRHMYLIGKTGMGKSTMIENMIIDDIRNGRGVGLVDPHGDLAEKVIKFIAPERINDVVYFNPADTENPIAFNILENVNPEHKSLVASGLVGVFKKIWADSWGPRLEYILINAILALLDYPGSTLLGVTRMLVDNKYRKKVVAQIQNPVVKMFWVEEYNNYSEKFRTEAIAPIQNKVGQFLSSMVIRNIVGQSKSTVDMREIMDNRKILIMNLSKGRIGEENSALMGAMMITKIQLAAMSRVDTPEKEREDFYLYVDEFQNFATESFADILSEARKYRLDLTLAHQYIEQLEDEVRAAVFGNVGTIVSFRVGSIDSEELEKEFGPTFTAEDLVNLSKYTTYMRLMIDGVASDPFSAIGLPPVVGAVEGQVKVIKVSRERYARPKEVVEEKIARWSGMDEREKQREQQEQQKNQGQQKGRQRPDQRHKAQPRQQPKSQDRRKDDRQRQQPKQQPRQQPKSQDRRKDDRQRQPQQKQQAQQQSQPKQEKQKPAQQPRQQQIQQPQQPAKPVPPAVPSFSQPQKAQAQPQKQQQINDLKRKKISFVQDENAPAPISLGQAVQQDPVQFSGKKRQKTKDKKAILNSQSSSTQQQAQTKHASSQQKHKIQPGQKVQF